MVFWMTRAPANPIKALGSAMITSPSIAKLAATPPVVGCNNTEMYRMPAVRMRPGAPLGFGLLDSAPWIGLPGNPVSAMVTFELFVRPVLRRMLGHTRLFRRPLPAVLEERVTIGARLTHFLRAIVSTGNNGLVTARLTGPQGSGILTSMSRANALLVVPEDRPVVEAGETLHALPFGDAAGLTTEFAL